MTVPAPDAGINRPSPFSFFSLSLSSSALALAKGFNRFEPLALLVVRVAMSRHSPLTPAMFYNPAPFFLSVYRITIFYGITGGRPTI